MENKKNEFSALLSQKEQYLDPSLTEGSKPKQIAGEAPTAQVIDGETRATFIIDALILDRLKSVAYWERKQIKRGST